MIDKPSYQGIVLVLMLALRVTKSLESAMTVSLKQTALPILFENDEDIIEELGQVTKIECGFRCFKRSCTGFLFKPQDQLDDKQCYSTSSHLEYTGTYNKTATGRTCQRWDSQSPHSHEMAAKLKNMPEKSLTEAENYCRDPDITGYLWSYTIDTDQRWEACDVMKCMAQGDIVDNTRSTQCNQMLLIKEEDTIITKLSIKLIVKSSRSRFIAIGAT